jgi:hypothetical protein
VDQVALFVSAGQPDRVRVDRNADPEQVEGGGRKSSIDGRAAGFETADCRLVRFEPSSELALAPSDSPNVERIALPICALIFGSVVCRDRTT